MRSRQKRTEANEQLKSAGGGPKEVHPVEIDQAGNQAGTAAKRKMQPMHDAHGVTEDDKATTGLNPSTAVPEDQQVPQQLQEQQQTQEACCLVDDDDTTRQEDRLTDDDDDDVDDDTGPSAPETATSSSPPSSPRHAPSFESVFFDNDPGKKPITEEGQVVSVQQQYVKWRFAGAISLTYPSSKLCIYTLYNVHCVKPKEHASILPDYI
jgi:hypothetical protein